MPEMPGFHDINVWVEKGLELLDALTKQVSRAAWALESQRFIDQDWRDAPCPSCQSQLVREDDATCPACGGRTKEPKSNG